MVSSETAGKNVRQPAVAGSFYTAHAKTLSEEIDGYLAKASSGLSPGNPLGLISPHAGYMYSGQVAAYAYKQVQGQNFDAVLVIAPSHRAYFPGASVDDAEAYQTPLGVVPVETELCSALRKRSSLFSSLPHVHMQEHALEVQIPFLQKVLTRFMLIPVIMGDQDLNTCEAIAEVIAEVIAGHAALIVASSDLSHYHPYDQAKLLDRKVMDAINNNDPRGLASDLQRHKTEACGGGPIITALLIGEHLGSDGATVLHYANSGDVTGDHSGVVGYLAGLIYRSVPSKKPKAERRKTGVDLGLTDDEKNLLHHIVKETIRSHAEGKPLPRLEVDSKTLMEPRGAFVSLHKRGMLRGCIGHIRSDRPLHETVRDMAVAAAFEDPRFPPLGEKELAQVDIEISVLTPFKKISDVTEIEVGKHGLYLVKGFSSGLLLPQVATEYGWNRITFLEHTCTKAGLGKNAWKEKDTEIYIFSADVF